MNQTEQQIDVYELEPGQEVSCYYCIQDRNHAQYKRGEAFLAGPDHVPCDGNANFICREHLSPRAVVYRPFPQSAASAG